MSTDSAWSVLAESAVGTSHSSKNQPCQDAFRWAIRPRDHALIVAVADGAGSSEFAEVGARIACDELIRIALDAVEDNAVGWFQQVRSALEIEAVRRECPIRQLACTLLLAVVGDSTSLFAQIGDGAIVVKRNDSWDVLFWPEPSEYANGTHFVTDEGFEESISNSTIREPLNEVALFSDGLQRLALDFSAKLGHSAFFTPLFDELRNCADSDSLRDAFRQFLESPRINSRTDDDKTLVIASRTSP